MFTDWLKKMICISTVFALFFLFKILTMLKSNFLSTINLPEENKMTHTFRAIEIALAAMIAVLPLTAATPAWAEGSNSTSPATTPITPATLITDQVQLSTVGAGGCAQQYTAAINSLIDLAIIDNDWGLGLTAGGLALETFGLGTEIIANAANWTGAIADEVAQAAEAATWATGGVAQIAGGASMLLGVTVVALPVVVPLGGTGMGAGGVAMEAAAASSGVQALATGAKIVGLAAETAGLASSALGLADQAVGFGFQIDAQAKSKQAHALTKYVATLPNCNAEFTGTVEVSSGGVNVTGTSIFNDDVGVAADVNVEGDVNASQVHATQGISAVGGGIWIGDPNGTTYSSGITLGGGAVSGAGLGGAQAFTSDVDAMAIGNNARAMMGGSLALGLDSSSTSADAIAIGNAAAANGVQDVVVGALNNTDAGGNNTVVGNEIDIIGAASSNNTVLGVGHQVTGSGNFVGGDPNTIIGSMNVATGVGSNVTGDSNVAIGDTVNITGDRAIAVGNNATANADDTTVIGTNAQANATGSAAYGQGAVASQTQQQVFGTQANTYTTPGITSGLSKARQAGPLEVTTSDATGNLATDGGLIFETLSENQAGIAIAMALEMPALHADETFGIAVNWGIFEQSQALGFSAMGVVARDVFSASDRISLTGGFGFSVKEKSFGGHSTRTACGGRVGVQLSW